MRHVRIVIQRSHSIQMRDVTSLSKMYYERSGVSKMKQQISHDQYDLPKYITHLHFVTMEDIIPGELGMNHVIYNPMLTKEENEKILKKATDYHFKHHHLTENDFDELTSYDVHQLHEFIAAYKKKLHIEL